jgi:hypothetical protein
MYHLLWATEIAFPPLLWGSFSARSNPRLRTVREERDILGTRSMHAVVSLIIEYAYDGRPRAKHAFQWHDH